MLETYEAVYEDGRLEWLGQRPRVGRHRVLVIVLEEKMPDRSPEDIQLVLDQTRGAWGTGKTPEEIDREIEAMRTEWDRPWHGPEESRS